MQATWLLVAMIPLAYVLGSIPFGLIVGLAKGIDPRKAGSGNIGATNVGRLLGGRYFALVFILDMLKGLLPMAFASGALRHHAMNQAMYLLWLLVGFACILGHTFSLFLKFKGGKGVATSSGVALGLFPYYTFPGLIAILVWLAIFLPSRIVSLASIIAALVFPVAYLVLGLIMKWDVLGAQLPLLLFAMLVGGLIVLRHRANIVRLRAGTESRFGVVHR